VDRNRRKKAGGGVVVQGLDDILIKFGKCCQPVPGDPIIGYITRGQGVTVHRANCTNTLRLSPERQIEVEWDTGDKETYPVKIRVLSFDRVGLLADLAANISKNEANILRLKTETLENKTVDSLFILAVEDTAHLERVLADLRKVKMVQDAKRIG